MRTGGTDADAVHRQPRPRIGAVRYLDQDGFKQVNDGLGPKPET
jgi:hypothetical protein